MNKTTEAIDILSEILDRKLEEVATLDLSEDRSILISLVEFLYGVKNDVRLYALATDDQVVSLWDTLRDNEFILDFVLESTSELMIRLPYEIDTLYGILDKGYTCYHTTKSLIDVDTVERLPTATFIYYTLTENPWLLFYFLIKPVNLTRWVK